MDEDHSSAIKATISAPIISKSGVPPDDQRGGHKPSLITEEMYADRAAICHALRVEGYSYKEIEEKTGLTACQIRTSCRKARAAGHLHDVLHLVDHEAVPQAVENLVGYLQQPDTAIGQKATFSTLKGRGVFRNFAHNKNDTAPGVTLPQLNIEIVAPAGGGMPTVIVNNDRGAVIGVEKED